MDWFLFTRLSNRDDFADWCYFNGILWMPSSGSKIGQKLGITQADLNRARRFDIVFQLGRFHDWLLAFQIPILALIAINISNLQLMILKMQHKDMNEDLDLHDF